MTSHLPTLYDLRQASAFLLHLPAFLSQSIDAAKAAELLVRRIHSRERAFLAIIANQVLAYSRNPYTRLFHSAGLEMGDLEILLRQEGLEGALEHLMRVGVYLSVDEFKGRKPIERGSLCFWAGPESLRNPCSGSHVQLRSSGSRSNGGTPMSLDLKYVVDSSVNRCLLYAMLGGQDWVKAKWGVPGSMALVHVLEFTQFGNQSLKWYSQLDPASPDLHLRYRISGKALKWVSRLVNKPVPKPEYVPLNDPTPIARWLASILAQGRIPCLHTYVSNAVRLCRVALESGIDISGARLLVSGEPITPARIKAIASAGAIPLARYGTAEAGPIAYGCISGRQSAEMHFLRDLHALIQAGDQADRLGVPSTALYLTTLRPTSPFTMINVSLGDQAELTLGDCCCPLGGKLWPQMLNSVNSFEKLTGAGMAFLDAEVIRVLEDVLPGRFGGVATDYQLVENEGPQGEPRLHLLIRPELGSMDPKQVERVFFEALAPGSGASRVMGLTWRQAGILKIERRAPHTTTTGKIQHLHLARNQSSA